MAEDKVQKQKETKEKKAQAKAEKKAPQASAHGMYHYISEAWKKPSEGFIEDLRNKTIGWRAGKRITKIEKPTRLDRARALGYKAKKGFVVFRVTVKRGGRQRIRPVSHRKGKRQSVKSILHMNYKWVAEQRVQNKYRNLEILNSYLLGKDGKYYFFEVIAVDPYMPEIKSDPTINWICKPENQGRAFRGLTSSAKKARGLRTKSHELKVRPSLRAWGRKGR